ncbi:cysteine hydrolase [Desulfovibrio sulfodismutans]|uniref:Cysteine hydrolase n=1 Tax=Desulfolutivibrio sulfodismutans TaxID=63561 RepID=A0A7K3NRX5_9BACT|nr:isochorismatase family cysteine hydrolase [Desulfolutivibrio sulfodismutans]NDY58952.1 cysteine hydrolase [Desulfolutivibrio sulfodismutans]QLA12626.1 isochorismatase family protein [Desulfolutivibrio sulfodismutans DSM 3696]
MENALVIIDMLNDFLLPSGSLYFEKGQAVVGAIARLKAAFRGCGVQVVYGNDAHPKDSLEFSGWSPHCLAGSPGAQIVQELSPEAGDIVLYKDALSLFADGVAQRILRGLGVSHLFLVGVATEYSMKSSAFDALACGLTVTMVSDAVAGVDLREGDAEQALEALRDAGVRFVTTQSLIASLH